MSSIPRPDKRRGFTLTELLVVIGIIVLILSIATPMIARAWRSGDRTRMAADLQAIATALEAYRQDHGSYPLVGPPPTGIDTNFDGARMLCRALIGPGPETGPLTSVPDGKGGDTDPKQPAPGFRTRGTTGKVYGPYLPIERFKLGDPGPTGSTVPGFLAIMDRYNHPILYYLAVEKPNIRLPKGFVGNRGSTERPMYSATDNRGPMSVTTLARMLGDLNANGMIDASTGTGPAEQPATDATFLLWSAGPDETFGPPPGMPLNNPENIRKAVEKSDDVTNFRQ